MAKPTLERCLNRQFLPSAPGHGSPFITDRWVRGVLRTQQECEFHGIAVMLRQTCVTRFSVPAKVGGEL
jgi:hypothetical protein